MLQRNVYLTHGNNYNNHIAEYILWQLRLQMKNIIIIFIFEEVKYLGHMGEVIDPLLNT